MGWEHRRAVGVRSRRKGLAPYISQNAAAAIGARIVSFTAAAQPLHALRRPAPLQQVDLTALHPLRNCSSAFYLRVGAHPRTTSVPVRRSRSSNIKRLAPDSLPANSGRAMVAVLRVYSPAAPCRRLGRPSFANNVTANTGHYACATRQL
ncbi:hypothetical protein B0J12DRAFT_118934 [Macrophomina phaseolina]|uniref:Uncharacterized protein n=1 Tax=Macrophomina phaseolina TaxID=35725 RepID=A0ABQ8G8B6_9PEZI|nr:hypothetical protein B0J12DRAFT_118934 [Macrophomina phaseolina]